MKRSEMVEILEKSFFKHMNSTDHQSDVDIYSAVLNDLEDAGMLPPLFHFDNEREEGHVVHCIWEPEDTTNENIKNIAHKVMDEHSELFKKLKESGD